MSLRFARRLAASLALGLAACVSAAGPARLTGTVGYRERMALPPGAVVHVALLDVSEIGVPPRVIAEQEIRPTQQAPIPFVLEYERGAIDAGRRYGLRATISDANGRVLWGSASSSPVFGEGTSDTHALVLQRARAVLDYACADLAFRVEVAPDGVRLRLPEGRSVDLPAVPSASGARYSDGRDTFWSKGDDALLTLDGIEHAGCRLEEKSAP